MIKTFNTTGLCIPEKHYMADTSDKIERIVNELIDNGKYFTINQARQFGKTTTMYLLEKRLHERYVVISISFEAADFMIDMSLNEKEISTMLQQYENDYNTGMNVDKMAEELYSYTDGYPYMVSRLCEILHDMRAFNHSNLLDAVKEKNTLYDDISKKLKEYPQLKERIYAILFTGRSFPYHIEEEITNIGVMFGFLKEKEGQVVIANRLFEIWFYNLFIAEETNNNPLYDAGLQIKNRFVNEDSLDMDLILRKFIEYYSEIYGSSTDKQELFSGLADALHVHHIVLSCQRH